MKNEEQRAARKPYKIGYVPGVYDLFHIGHLNLIRRAKEQSDHLIVGVLSDELVKHFKNAYPYIPLEERMEIVRALKYTDQVVEVNFENTVKMDAWKLYHYDAYFSGSDHGEEWDQEKRQLQEVGSDIVFLPYTMSTSSTKIKRRIRDGERPGRLYLFGAGKIGRNTLKKLRDEECRGRWTVEGFLDNSPEKHLTRIDGAVVYGPEDLQRLETGQDYGILITLKEGQEAEEQLAALGLGQRIFREL